LSLAEEILGFIPRIALKLLPFSDPLGAYFFLCMSETSGERTSSGGFSEKHAFSPFFLPLPVTTGESASFFPSA